jgi:hypothetical protein
MGIYLSDDERRALWEPEDTPSGPAARAWEPPEIRAARYEKALRGILGCASESPTVWLLQSVAATALGLDQLAARLLADIEGKK